jgi:hypothetical protein
LPGSTGQSSNPCATGVTEALPQLGSGGYWIARLSRAMTVGVVVDGLLVWRLRASAPFHLYRLTVYLAGTIAAVEIGGDAFSRTRRREEVQ